MSITFPDNGNRERRVTEIVTDINSSIIRITDLEQEINKKITKLNETSQRILRSIEPEIAGKVSQIDLHGKIWTINNLILSAVTFEYAYKALSKAVASRIISNVAREIAPGVEMTIESLGRPIVEGAAKELEIPLKAKLIGGVGGAVLSVGVGFAIDAIEGAIARSKLRDSIRDNLPRRTKQKRNELQVTKLHELVGSLFSTLTIIEEIDDVDYTKERLEKVVTKTISKYKPELAVIDDNSANTELQKLDKDRGSWTDEDHLPS
jgi:hypothetical protein